MVALTMKSEATFHSGTPAEGAFQTAPVLLAHETLLNCGQLAEAMRRNPYYVTAMKSGGYRMQYPGRTTLSHALAWLAAHLDFKTTEYAMRRTPRAHRPRQSAGKSGEPFPTSGSHSASPPPA